MDEREAITRLLEDDIGGLEMLVRRYQTEATRIAQLITRDQATAEDVVQHAFVRLYERIGQLDPTRPFAPWFFRAVSDDAVRAADTAVPPNQSDPGTEDQRLSEEPVPSQFLGTLEQFASLSEALRVLPPRQRAAIALRYYARVNDGEKTPASRTFFQHVRDLLRQRDHQSNRQLRRELRHIVQQEVPDDEPDLWPEIRRQVAPRRTPYSSPGNLGGSLRQESANGSGDIDSVYVFSTAHASPLERHARLLVVGAVVLLLLVLLAVVIRHRGGHDHQPVLAIASPTAAASPTLALAFGVTAPPLAWTQSGQLTVPVVPAPGVSVGGEVQAQILPTGDLRLIYRAQALDGVMTWHLVVAQTCSALAGVPEPALAERGLIPAFLDPGGSAEFVPAEKTHQSMAMAAYLQSGGTPVACAAIPAIPSSLIVAYDPAPGVPRTCPVTVPTVPRFVPSEATADPRFGDGDYWFGTDDLYTALPLDGVWPGVEKAFWWAAGYSPNAVPVPALNVNAEQLDGGSPAAQVEPKSNSELGMLTRIAFPSSGCWRVTAQYRGHALVFIVWVNASTASTVTQAPGPVPVIAATPGADGLTHTDQACHATPFGPSTAHPSDLNIEFRGFTSSGQFWALMFQPMPLYARQNVAFAWRIGAADALKLTVEDANGNRIDPTSGPSPSASTNWPRPGNEWRGSITFPYSGCWHVHAQAGTFSGDMWFELFAQPVLAVPPATSTAVAEPKPIETPATPHP